MTAPTQTALAEVALAFAKDCLGWKDARLPRQRCFGGGVLITTRNPNKYLRPDILDDVMSVVEEWTKEHRYSASLHCFEGNAYTAIIRREDEVPGIVGRATNRNHCHALLSACVKAARKLREAA